MSFVTEQDRAIEEYLRAQKETTVLMKEIKARETAKNELDKVRKECLQVLIEDISARKVQKAVMEMKAIAPSLTIATTAVGFLLASIFDTTMGEFQDWSILGAALTVASVETASKIYYSFISRVQLLSSKTYYSETLFLLNSFKLGLTYGLIVDAFKLGS